MMTQKNKTLKKIKNFKNVKNFKKLNCSPYVKNKKALDHSCFTKDNLIKLKEVYNEHQIKNGTNKLILETNSVDIWNSLYKKIPQCNQESCWLNQIPNKTLKNSIMNKVFAPKHPKSWINNENEWLSNIDILNVLQQYDMTYSTFKFIGPSPIDFNTTINGGCICNKLCTFSIDSYIKQSITDIGVIFNLDNHNGPGTHWVSLYIHIPNTIEPNTIEPNTIEPNTIEPNTIEPNTIESNTIEPNTININHHNEAFILYFDSTGQSIPSEINVLKNKIITQYGDINRNNTMHYFENKIEHQKKNTECGMYSMFMIITMLLKEHPITKKHQTTKQLLNILINSKRIPDNYVERYRKIYFNT